MLKTKDLYDLTHTKAAPILENTEYPWEALGKIKDFIIELGMRRSIPTTISARRRSSATRPKSGPERLSAAVRWSAITAWSATARNSRT